MVDTLRYGFTYGNSVEATGHFQLRSRQRQMEAYKADLYQAKESAIIWLIISIATIIVLPVAASFAPSYLEQTTTSYTPQMVGVILLTVIAVSAAATYIYLFPSYIRDLEKKLQSL